MKNNVTTLLLSLFLIQGFSQKNKYEYHGRSTPAIKKEKLNKAIFITEIMPQFCSYFMLPPVDHYELNDLLRMEDSPKGYHVWLYPQESFYHQENYERIMDIIAIEMIASCRGKIMSAKSKKITISNEQKNILNNTDLGTDIRIKIKFKFKYQTANNTASAGDIKEGEYLVTVVPETEAQYPGGFKELTQYLNQNVMNKITNKSVAKKIKEAIVKFTINENGQLDQLKMARTSTDLKIDKLILEAIRKMPEWIPAQNVKGFKVKQELSIAFGGGGC